MTTAAQRVEFGDFQTPRTLADRVCELLHRHGVRPATVVEPTCGLGSFLFSTLDRFPDLERAIALDVNAGYIRELERLLSLRPDAAKVTSIHQSFFNADWRSLLDGLPDPMLVIGNPPWVTNAELGALGSENLPAKSNFQRASGLDAITGKSNFDISEWMLLEVLKWLAGRTATMAMLCKTQVARKVLSHAWKGQAHLNEARVYRIDAAAHFRAAVDACLLVCSFSPSSISTAATFYATLDAGKPISQFGYRDDCLIADLDAYQQWKHLCADPRRSPYVWRSGVKHDCSSVMELRNAGGKLVNRLGDVAELEDRYLYPMLKSSKVAKGQCEDPGDWMLVTQTKVGSETGEIRKHAPLTWAYLEAHAHLLDRRRSSIYRNRPRFSVFGVGDYTFAPWKVAISGFYKALRFKVIGSFASKPIVVDDTVYFLPCHSSDEAHCLAALLNSDEAREFFSAFVFWDAKRPITVDLLRRLSLTKLARQLNRSEELDRLLSEKLAACNQGQLF